MRQGFYLRLRKIKNLHFKTVRVQIMPTFRCNNNCSYCTRHFTGPMTVKRNENQPTAQEWLERIDQFPIAVDYVTFSGGEPLLYFDIANLVNGLIDRGICVTIFTNGNGFNPNIKRNPRLRFIATLHEGVNGKRFQETCDWYMLAGYRVDVDLMQPKKFGVNHQKDRREGVTDKGVIKIGTYSWKECNEYPVFNYGPDGTLATSPGQTWHHYRTGETRRSIIWTL